MVMPFIPPMTLQPTMTMQFCLETNLEFALKSSTIVCMVSLSPCGSRLSYLQVIYHGHVYSDHRPLLYFLKGELMTSECMWMSKSMIRIDTDSMASLMCPTMNGTSSVSPMSQATNLNFTSMVLRQIIQTKLSRLHPLKT